MYLTEELTKIVSQFLDIFHLALPNGSNLHNHTGIIKTKELTLCANNRDFFHVGYLTLFFIWRIIALQ